MLIRVIGAEGGNFVMLTRDEKNADSVDVCEPTPLCFYLVAPNSETDRGLVAAIMIHRNPVIRTASYLQPPFTIAACLPSGESSKPNRAICSSPKLAICRGVLPLSG